MKIKRIAKGEGEVGKKGMRDLPYHITAVDFPPTE